MARKEKSSVLLLPAAADYGALYTPEQWCHPVPNSTLAFSTPVLKYTVVNAKGTDSYYQVPVPPTIRLVLILAHVEMRSRRTVLSIMYCTATPV